jgi:hypothetical protein
MENDKMLDTMREVLRTALNSYEKGLRNKLDSTPRGSGHAANEFDHLQASITQVRSAKRVLWMED